MVSWIENVQVLYYYSSYLPYVRIYNNLDINTKKTNKVMKFSRLLTTIKSDRYYSYEVMDNKYEYSTTRNKQGGRKKKKQNNSCLFVEQLRCMQRFKQEFAVAVMMLHTRTYLYNNNKK